MKSLTTGSIIILIEFKKGDDFTNYETKKMLQYIHALRRSKEKNSKKLI